MSEYLKEEIERNIRLAKSSDNFDGWLKNKYGKRVQELSKIYNAMHKNKTVIVEITK